MRLSSVLIALCVPAAAGFHVHGRRRPVRAVSRALSHESVHDNDNDNDNDGEQRDEAIQWELFKKHHARGSWKGVWTSYNFIGDVIDETVASVDLELHSDARTVTHQHTIVVGAKKSDCDTCFDSFETKTLPVAQYTPQTLSRRNRLGANGMIVGPSVVKSGAMATELVLSHGDGRVRVVFQHAPVWEAGVEPGSCPPQGLKLFRAMVAREALRSSAPTPETEAANPPAEGNPVFCRPVPPFNYHKKWGGTSWTWGPQSGNQGWGIEELEESDSWHGITPVDSWNLRLPGGIHVQAPKIVTDANTALCRMAWLPNDDTLLRLEGGIIALQPLMIEDDTMVGFEPPSLTSYRCDVMKKLGELENTPRPSQEWNNNSPTNDTSTSSSSSSSARNDDTKVDAITDKSNAQQSTDISDSKKDIDKNNENDGDKVDSNNNNDSGLQSIRDALSL